MLIIPAADKNAMPYIINDNEERCGFSLVFFGRFRLNISIHNYLVLSACTRNLGNLKIAFKLLGRLSSK